MSKADFDKALKEWIAHCRQPEVQFSSIAEDVRDVAASRKIISMGYEALPFVRQAYDMDSSDNFALAIVQGHGLVGVVRAIVGDDFSIPQEIRGNIPKIESYTRAWLDQNMHKYAKQEDGTK
jgi:hypothetical protein